MQISHNFPTCMVEITLHALKGQKLLAQGSALGFCLCESSTPCKGKSFTYRRGFSFFIRCILKLLPLQGALLTDIIPRVLPWAKSFCPFTFPLRAGDRWFRACWVISTIQKGVLLDFICPGLGAFAPYILQRIFHFY